MTKLVKGDDLTIVESPVVSPEVAWATLVDWVLSQQHTPGQIAIPSGTDTGLWCRVTKDYLPFGVAFDVLEAGIRKPLTDISVQKTVPGDNWHHCHDRRLKRLGNWKEGKFAARGGSKDELGTQMREEWIGWLRSKGFNPDKHAEFFKGNVVAMLNAWEAAGNTFKAGRDGKLAELRTAATKTLADRGKAAAELVTTGLEA